MKKMSVFLINLIDDLFEQGGSRDQTLCNTLTCWDATSGDWKTSVSVRAYDGTTCGNRKWCMNGTCVSSYAAPPTDTGASHHGLDISFTERAFMNACFEMYKNTRNFQDCFKFVKIRYVSFNIHLFWPPIVLICLYFTNRSSWISVR